MCAAEAAAGSWRSAHQVRQSREFSSHKTWSRGGVYASSSNERRPAAASSARRAASPPRLMAVGGASRVDLGHGSQLFSGSVHSSKVSAGRSPASRRTMTRDTAPLTSRAPLPRIDVARHAADQKNSRSDFRGGRRSLPRPAQRQPAAPSAARASSLPIGRLEAACSVLLALFISGAARRAPKISARRRLPSTLLVAAVLLATIPAASAQPAPPPAWPTASASAPSDR